MGLESPSCGGVLRIAFTPPLQLVCCITMLHVADRRHVAQAIIVCTKGVAYTVPRKELRRATLQIQTLLSPLRGSAW